MLTAVRSKQDERKKEFKKGIDLTELRRRRVDYHLNICKNRREELASKRRNIHFDGPLPTFQAQEEEKFALGDLDSVLATLFRKLHSGNHGEIFQGVHGIRKNPFSGVTNRPLTV